jgi:serine/threonine-protein kinase RIM15
MADAGLFGYRRDVPSPLTFTASPSLTPSAHDGHPFGGAGASEMGSMPFVRRHVTRRLKAAKEDCDKEMQRITNSITTYFEQKLKESEYEKEAEKEVLAREREKERERVPERNWEKERGRYREEGIAGSPEAWSDYAFQPGELKSALQSDEGGSDSGTDVESERRNRHSRQGTCLLLSVDNAHRPELPSASRQSTDSSSPAPVRRHDDASRSRNAMIVGSPPVSSNLTTHTSLAARRLSRTIHIPARSNTSGQTSRSTSRSRSPLPPSSHTSNFSDAFSQRSMSERGAQSPSANRRSSRILVDDPIDPLMTALYALIGVAQDVLDTSVTQLTSNPKFCEAAITRVQAIGKSWDDHPDWHGRNWFVQILLAVASLSRVLEWWEAEKSFWNFDEKGNEEDEPLQFVAKFVDEDEPPSVTESLVATPANESTPMEGNVLGLTAEEQGRLRLSRPPSNGKRSRDEVRNLAATIAHKEEEISRASKTVDMTESARVLATERLRLQAETAQNRNIVVELDLDGERFVWVNYAWDNVVG